MVLTQLNILSKILYFYGFKVKCVEFMLYLEYHLHIFANNKMLCQLDSNTFFVCFDIYLVLRFSLQTNNKG